VRPDPYNAGCAGPAESVRERLHRVLREAPATTRDLTRSLGIRVRDVADHLEHLDRSLRRIRERRVVQPASCLECGFAFSPRTRYTRSGHCPKCRSTHTTPPVFRAPPCLARCVHCRESCA
jgi:predicted Zn-ribbon and HTH transcriptional regulator